MSIFASTASVVDERRMMRCPVCQAGPVWRNVDEFAEHVDACLRILRPEMERIALEATAS